MMKIRIPFILAVLCLIVRVAHASSIGVFFAPDGSDCDGVAAPLTPFNIYIGAVLGGDTAAAGMAGAEFSLAGADPAWLTTITPNPAANLTIGSPVTGGCNIAFPVCQPGPFVPLYTIQFISPVAIPPSTFTIRRHFNQSAPSLPCPLFAVCDASFTKLCVTGGQAFLNDPTRACAVGVEQRSWAAVKSIFR